MVDLSGKAATLREATAAGRITMSAAAFAAVRAGALAKGDVIAVARLAGIAAAKRTAELIPLCHSLPLDHIALEVRFDAGRRALDIEATTRTRFSTGVEMEAMVAVAAALLTVYDMVKGMDRSMTLGPLRLLKKSGGRSGDYAFRAKTGRRAR